MAAQLIERFGEEHVLLGTDYPYDMGVDDPLGFVEGLKLSRAGKDRIEGGNAARLLKIGYNNLTRRRS
jgi:aminocarboxymuconate-semialdehyde decarboxylase